MRGIDAPGEAGSEIDGVEPGRLDIPTLSPDGGSALGGMGWHLRNTLWREEAVEPVGSEADRGVRQRRLDDRRVWFAGESRRVPLESGKRSPLGARRRSPDERRGKKEVG
jgi:hypothetical protein